MNIKGVINFPVNSVEPKSRVEGPKTQSTADRDADGRQQQEQQEQKRHLSQEEFDEALKALAETPGLKVHNLTIKVETHEDARVIFVLDKDGQVVRRLSEAQLWTATRNKERQTGKILDKAM